MDIVGYDVTCFVDLSQIVNYKCKVCQQILRNPVNTPQGCEFCKLCICKHIDLSEAEDGCVTCPSCNNERLSKASLNICKRSQEYIEQLTTRCPNFSNMVPCQWQGTVLNYANHVENCSLELSECEAFKLGCCFDGCYGTFLRRDRELHVEVTLTKVIDKVYELKQRNNALSTEMDVLRAENTSLKSELGQERQWRDTLESKLKVFSNLVQVASAEKEATEATISTSNSSNSQSLSNELTPIDAEHSTVGTDLYTVDTAVDKQKDDQDVEQAAATISEFTTTIDSSISHCNSTASEVVVDTEMVVSNNSSKRKLSHESVDNTPGEIVPSQEFLFTDMNADDSPLPELEPAKPAPATKKRKVPLPPLWFLKDGGSRSGKQIASEEIQKEMEQEQEQEMLPVSPALGPQGQQLRYITPSTWTIKEITVLYTLATTKLGVDGYTWHDIATELGFLAQDCRTKWTQLKRDLKLEKGEYLTPLTHSQAVVVDTQLHSCETYDELGKAVTWTILANEFCCSALQLRIRLQLYLNKQKEKLKVN